MKDFLVTTANNDGVAFPATAAVNSSGPATTDGTEYVAPVINETWGVLQAVLDYAGETPNGVTEAAGASQFITSVQKGTATGPGVYSWWGIDDDPATTGHRVLLLNNQGVLRSSYLDLDAAVYVGDGNNPTAPYNYHADDAGGVTRNIAGIYLILPHGKQLYEKQYLGDGTDFTVASAGWVTSSAVATPYQSSNGAWRLNFNIGGSLAATINPSITISGTVFKTGPTQSITVSKDGDPAVYADAISGTNIIVGVGNVAATGWRFSGDIELDSEPTWTDGFNYKLGVTY